MSSTSPSRVRRTNSGGAVGLCVRRPVSMQSSRLNGTVRGLRKGLQEGPEVFNVATVVSEVQFAS